MAKIAKMAKHFQLLGFEVGFVLVAGAAWAWVEFLMLVWCTPVASRGPRGDGRIYLSVIAGGLGACGQAERGSAALGSKLSFGSSVDE